MSTLKENEIFFDTQTQEAYVWKVDPSDLAHGGDLMLFATVGAPEGTMVAGIDASELASSHVDFNSGNNQNREPIVFAGFVQTAALPPSNNGDGTASVTIGWKWSTSDTPAVQIDGFFVQVLEDVAAQTNFPDYTSANFRATAVKAFNGKENYTFTHVGVMNNYMAFKITPYRYVDKQGNLPATTLLGASPVVIPAIRPFDKLTFDNLSVTEMAMQLDSMIEDSALEPKEKRILIYPWLDKLSDTNPESDYSVTLARLTAWTPTKTEDQNTKTALINALNTARTNALALLNAQYVVVDPKDYTKDLAFKSQLIEGAAEYTYPGNVLTGNTKLNRLKTHRINRDVFRDTLNAYSSASNGASFALDLYLLGANEQASELISTLSDLVVDKAELVSLKSRYENSSVETNELVEFGLYAGVSTTSLTTARTNIEDGLKLDRYSISELGVVSQTPNLAIFPEMNGGVPSNLSRKFGTKTEAINFYLLWDAWYDELDAARGAIETAVSDINTTVNAFPNTTVIEKLVLGLIDPKYKLKLTAAMQTRLLGWTKTAWLTANEKSLKAKGANTSTFTGLQTTLGTLLDVQRTVINTVTRASTTSSIRNFKADSTVLLISSTTDLRALFDILVNLEVAQDALEAALGTKTPQKYEGTVPPLTYFGQNPEITLITGDEYFDKTTKIRYHYDEATGWAVDGISPDVTITIDGQITDFNSVFGLVTNYGDNSRIDPKEKLKLQELYNSMLLEDTRFTQAIAKYGIITNYTTTYSALKTFLEARYPAVKTSTWKDNMTTVYQGVTKTLHTPLLGDDTNIYYEVSGGGVYNNTSTKAKDRYSRVDPVAYETVVQNYLNTVTALRKDITEKERLEIPAEATIDKGTAEAPDVVSIVSYIKGLDTVLDDDVIVYKEKIATGGIRDILADAKAEHNNVLERYRYYGVSDASYIAAYNALVTALEETRYQICIMPRKVLVAGRFSTLLGSEKTEYSAITGGTAFTTGGRTEYSSTVKSHLIPDVEAFKTIIYNYQLTRNTSAKLNERGIYKGNATTPAGIPHAKVPGSVYWNETTKQLFGVRYAYWVLVARLEAANEGFGEGAPADNLSQIRFYDTKNGLYYTRKKTTSKWELTPIIKPITASGSTLPSKTQ